MAKASVFDVAKYILEETGDISVVKLQKLTYYAQAWHYVWSEEPLFDEKIYAWMNGPVCPELYQKHKGRFCIADIEGDISNLNEDEKESIDAVLGYYRGYDGKQLSDLTHKEDPWLKARGTLKSYDKGGDREITLASMKEYYESL